MDNILEITLDQLFLLEYISSDEEAYNIIFKIEELSFEEKLYFAGEYAKYKIKKTIDVFYEINCILTKK